MALLDNNNLPIFYRERAITKEQLDQLKNTIRDAINALDGQQTVNTTSLTTLTTLVNNSVADITAGLGEFEQAKADILAIITMLTELNNQLAILVAAKADQVYAMQIDMAVSNLTAQYVITAAKAIANETRSIESAQDIADFLTGDQTVAKALTLNDGTNSATAAAVKQVVDWMNQSVRTDASPEFVLVKTLNGYTITDTNLIDHVMNWDLESGTLAIGIDNDVTLQVGQESHIPVKNASGGAYTDFHAVMIDPANPVSGSNLNTLLTDISVLSSFPEAVVGIATQPIGDQNNGKTSWFGLVGGDTRSRLSVVGGVLTTADWVEGQILYVSQTAGQLVAVNPATRQADLDVALPKPLPRVLVGLVEKAGPGGRIRVRPSFPIFLRDINDIIESNPQSGDMFINNGDGNYHNFNVFDVDMQGHPTNIKLSWLPNSLEDIVEVASYAELIAIASPSKNIIYKITDDDDPNTTVDTFYRWTGSAWLRFDERSARWGFVTGNIADQVDIENATFTPTTEQILATTLKTAINEVGADLKNIIDGITDIAFATEQAAGDTTLTVTEDTIFKALEKLGMDIKDILDDTSDIAFLTDYTDTETVLTANETNLDLAIEKLGLEIKDILDATSDIVFVPGTSGLDSTTIEAAIKEIYAEKAQANGIATLDADGKVPANQLTIAAMEYQGAFGATTGDLPTVGVSKGDYYRCESNGYVSAVAGQTFNTGDAAIYNGTTWDKNDNTDAVLTVNTKSGEVVLDATDIAWFEGRVWTGFLLDQPNVETALEALDNHVHPFSTLTSKPTTIAGYGITDAYTKDEVDTRVTSIHVEQFRIVNPDLGDGTFSYLDSGDVQHIGTITGGWYQFTLQEGGFYAGSKLVTADINDGAKIYKTTDSDFSEDALAGEVTTTVSISRVFLASDEIDIEYFQGVSIVSAVVGDGSITYGKLDSRLAGDIDILEAAGSAAIANTIVRRNSSNEFAGVLSGNLKTPRNFSIYDNNAGAVVTAGTETFNGSADLQLLMTLSGLNVGYTNAEMAGITNVKEALDWLKANGAAILMQDTTPDAGSYPEGTMWFDTGTGDFYVLYSGNWVDTDSIYSVDVSQLTSINSGALTTGSPYYDQPSDTWSMLGLATPGNFGLMSGTDKTNLDAMWNIWSADDGTDTLVNKVQEVLTVFSNFPEADTVVGTLATKATVSDYTTTIATTDTWTLDVDHYYLEKTVSGLLVADDNNKGDLFADYGSATVSMISDLKGEFGKIFDATIPSVDTIRIKALEALDLSALENISVVIKVVR